MEEKALESPFDDPSQSIETYPDFGTTLEERRKWYNIVVHDKFVALDHSFKNLTQLALVEIQDKLFIEDKNIACHAFAARLRRYFGTDQEPLLCEMFDKESISSIVSTLYDILDKDLASLEKFSTSLEQLMTYLVKNSMEIDFYPSYQERSTDSPL